MAERKQSPEKVGAMRESRVPRAWPARSPAGLALVLGSRETDTSRQRNDSRDAGSEGGAER